MTAFQVGSDRAVITHRIGVHDWQIQITNVFLVAPGVADAMLTNARITDDGEESHTDC